MVMSVSDEQSRWSRRRYERSWQEGSIEGASSISRGTLASAWGRGFGVHSKLAARSVRRMLANNLASTDQTSVLSLLGLLC
jgi:hypothetical protein